MRKSRKTIGIDAEYAELLRDIAKKRGMSIASYLRRLIEETVRVEEMGYFAPRALSEKRAEIVLSRLGFVLAIPELVNDSKLSDEVVVERGINVGRALVELEVDPLEVLELVGMSNQLIVIQGENVVILPQHDSTKRKLALLLKGIAIGSGLSVFETGEVTVVSPSKRSLKV